MAFDEVSAGNVIVNVFDAVLSDPKSSTHTAAPVVALYMRAPLQVNDAGFQTAF
jgi:hypothetical protein